MSNKKEYKQTTGLLMTKQRDHINQTQQAAGVIVLLRPYKVERAVIQKNHIHLWIIGAAPRAPWKTLQKARKLCPLMTFPIQIFPICSEIWSSNLSCPPSLLSFLITTDAELTGTVVLWCVTIQSSCGSSSPRSSLWISGSRCSRIQQRKLR